MPEFSGVRWHRRECRIWPVHTNATRQTSRRTTPDTVEKPRFELVSSQRTFLPLLGESTLFSVLSNRRRAGFPACRFTGLSCPVRSNARLESRPNRQTRVSGTCLAWSPRARRSADFSLQGCWLSEGGFGILRARLCGAHVPAG